MGEHDVDHREDRAQPFEVIVIGGSFAGLAAATRLGRARRNVLVLDAREPRNRFARHAHGFLGHDGRSPDEILALARAQLAAYPTVSSMKGLALSAQRLENGDFEIGTGACRFVGRRLVLATGVRDILPEIEGVSDLWGTGVFHCPYCHGYEVSGRPLAVLGNGEAGFHQAMMIPDWSDDVILFTNGPATFEAEKREALVRKGVRIEEAPVARLVRQGEELAAIAMEDGREIPRAGLFLVPRTVPSTDIAERLGCEITELPTGRMVKADEMRETSVKGVFAAGDSARPFGSISFAVADGAMAGSAAHRSLIFAP